MKADMIKKIEDNLRKRLIKLPNFVYDFIYSLDESQYRTKLEYTKDIQLFFEFLLSSEIIIKPSIGDIALSDINNLSERNIRDFLYYLNEYKKTFSTNTGKVKEQIFTNGEKGKCRKLATIHKFFSYLYNNELIKNNIASKINIKTHSNREIKDRLSKEQIETFLSTIVDDKNIESEKKYAFHQKVRFRDYIIVLILAYTGIRISELIQLDIDDVLVSKQHSKFGSLKVIRKGGNKEEIILPDIILEDIKNYLDERTKITTVDYNSKNALFLSLQKKRINDRTVRNMLEKYRIRCNIPFKITPHVFRRSFGTEHYNQYKDMYLTANVLGHRSAETTRKYYADISESRKIKTMTKFSYSNEDDTPNFSLEQLEFIAKSMNISKTDLLNKLKKID